MFLVLFCFFCLALSQFDCVQTSPISFFGRGKGPFSAGNKGNRRRLHAGNVSVLAYILINFSENRYL